MLLNNKKLTQFTMKHLNNFILQLHTNMKKKIVNQKKYIHTVYTGILVSHVRPVR